MLGEQCGELAMRVLGLLSISRAHQRVQSADPLGQCWGWQGHGPSHRHTVTPGRARGPRLRFAMLANSWHHEDALGILIRAARRYQRHAIPEKRGSLLALERRGRARFVCVLVFVRSACHAGSVLPRGFHPPPAVKF